MALMYADGAMFLGNGTGTNEQSSLIGSTIKTFVSILAESNLLTVLANNDTVLTNEIILHLPQDLLIYWQIILLC